MDAMEADEIATRLATLEARCDEFSRGLGHLLKSLGNDINMTEGALRREIERHERALFGVNGNNGLSGTSRSHDDALKRLTKQVEGENGTPGVVSDVRSLKEGTNRQTWAVRLVIAVVLASAGTVAYFAADGFLMERLKAHQVIAPQGR